MSPTSHSKCEEEPSFERWQLEFKVICEQTLCLRQHLKMK